MDGSRFDALSRLVGAPVTRRRALRAAVALVVGVATTRSLEPGASAAACSSAGKACRGGNKPVSCCEGLVCESKFCKVPSSGTCERDSHCSSGLVCRGGICTTRGDNGDVCSGARHCNAPLMCNRAEGRCRSKPGAACVEDATCGVGLACDPVKGKCGKRPAGSCATDAHCPGAICSSGACSQSCTPIPGYCYISTEGQAGGYPILQSGGFECTDSSQCTNQSICTEKPDNSICVCAAAIFYDGASQGAVPQYCGYMTLPIV